jgi:pimeloyl-ACP methyl ester carboxylesterase
VREEHNRASLPEARVLLVPGGGSSVHGYFPELASCLGSHAQTIEVDPPRLDVASGRRWLRLADHALWLAQAVRLDRDAPVIVVAHSLGGLAALRLALDEPELVSGLLLLDPSPLMPAALLPAGVLKLIAVPRKAAADLGVVGRRLRRDLRGGSFNVPQERSPAAPRSVPVIVRLIWYLVFDGVALAADLAAGRLAPIPTTVVSAAEHAPDSATRRTHERLVTWIGGARLEVWEGTTHPLHLQEPRKVAEAAIALLGRVS